MQQENLKTYIKTYLKTGFIQSFQFPADALIPFDKNPDASFWLCVNYWGLNNITIKNRNLPPFMGKALDQLSRVKQFTQFDLASVYHWMRIKKGNKWKTTFKTWYNYFKYQVMPFGLFNALASF